MARPTVNRRPSKKLIYIFCEGESEQCYAKFLKETFSDVAAIKIPKPTGLFSVAQDKFKKDRVFKDNIEVIDEIWFFFDVEEDERDKWGQYFKIIESLRKLRKKPHRITVRLLKQTYQRRQNCSIRLRCPYNYFLNPSFLQIKSKISHPLCLHQSK